MIDRIKGPGLPPQGPASKAAKVDGGAPAGAGAPSDSISLTFLHTNDMHGQLLPKESASGVKRGGMAYLASAINEERKGKEESTLLLDAGDSLAGSGIATLFAGRPMVEIMNAMKYDFVTLGNHDFNWTRSDLKQLLSKAEFQVTDSNVIDSSTAAPFLHETTGGNVIGKREMNGVKVGIIGLSTQDAYLTENPRNLEGIDILNPQAEVESDIRELRKWGADVVIVLSHLGLEKDQILAKAVPGIDLIFGGHTHDELDKPVKVGSTSIVQAGALGADLGRLELTLDGATKKITGIDYRLIPIDPGKIQPDEEVNALVQKYMNAASQELSKQLGETAKPLTRSGHVDSPLGNLVADALRGETGADIALINAGFLRTDHTSGAITKGDLLDMLPFDVNVVTMKLNGGEIRDILEQSVSQADPTREKSRMLQVSGLQVGYDLNAAPGNRLRQVLFNGEPVDANREYDVATIEFLAKGGLRYEQFVGKPMIDEGVNARDMVGTYIAENTPVIPEADGRIFLAERPEPTQLSFDFNIMP